MGVEFELKFAAQPRQHAAILDAYSGDWEHISMETTYYDTPAGELSQRRMTLRRRLENGVSVCTLKTPAAGDARGEWDCHKESIAAAIPELCKLSSNPVLSDLTAGGVTPVCGARFIRNALLLEFEDFSAELALDSGVLMGGGREIPLCEVELELKNGSETALADFAKAFSAQFGLIPEKKSKFRRASDLAKGE